MKIIVKKNETVQNKVEIEVPFYIRSMSSSFKIIGVNDAVRVWGYANQIERNESCFRSAVEALSNDHEMITEIDFDNHFKEILKNIRS